MTFVVLEECIRCKHTDCVEVCPVDCFYEGPNFLVIHPDECIDCALCEPECPVAAIRAEDEVPKAAIISAVPPLMVKTEGNPGGLPKSVFDDLQAQLAANRAQFYQDIPAGPFYGYNRPGAQPSEGIVRNWWRQGMMGGAKAHYDGIVAFSQTDFSDDLKRIDIPVLVMHGDDDQIVPYENSGVLSAKLLRNGTLKIYPGFPHGMPTTQAEVINADLLAFIRG